MTSERNLKEGDEVRARTVSSLLDEELGVAFIVKKGVATPSLDYLF